MGRHLRIKLLSQAFVCVCVGGWSEAEERLICNQLASYLHLTGAIKNRKEEKRGPPHILPLGTKRCILHPVLGLKMENFAIYILEPLHLINK